MKAKQYRKQIKELNAARAMYNPLRGISIQKVVNLLEAGERGEFRDLQWTYRMVEKRDAVLRSVKRRRLAALVKLDWNIKEVPEDQLPPGFTAKQAEAQAVALRKMYDQVANLKKAIKAVALAEFRGFAHLEKVYAENRPGVDRIVKLEPIKQWYWARDGIEGPWKFDPNLRGSHRSAEEVDPKHLLIREVEDPINEIALIAFLRKNMSQKDWDGFVEVFGIPDVFFTMPQGLGSDEQKEWLATAEQLAGDGRGALPFGADVKAVGGDVRGTNPFKEHLEYQDTMVVLAGTSGKLTMLSDATGIGSGASDAHEETFAELAQAEAMEISELFQEQLDLPLLEERFPGQPQLAYFELAATDEEDVNTVVKHACELKKAGIEMDVDDLAERTGYKLAAVALVQKATETAEKIKEEVKNRGLRGWLGQLFNRRSKPMDEGIEELIDSARAGIAAASAQDLYPIADRLNDLLQVPDADLAEALRTFQEEELPMLAEQLLENPQAAAAFEQTLSAAMVSAYVEGFDR